MSATHNMFTHFPKDPNCRVCQLTKTTRARVTTKAEKAPDDLPQPKQFADAITADHAILNEEDTSRDGDQIVLVIQDGYTKWLQSIPCKTKSAHETRLGILNFLGPQLKAKHAYTDNSKEFIKCFEDLGIPHDTCTPHRHETNGVVERAVRRVKEGTSSAMVQSGMAEYWWNWATKCFAFLRCVVDLIGGRTGWHTRFGVDFKGPVILFGAEVTYKPITEKDLARLHRFGAKMLTAIFLGYEQQQGGGWSGDL